MRWLGLFISFLSFPILALAIEPHLTLTAQENGLEPQDTFSCSGKIHGYLTLSDNAVGKHQLEGIWILPNGKVLEQTRIPIDFAPPGRSTAYLWLAFTEKTPSVLALNTSQDEMRLSYNGTWHLRVLWDEKPLLQTTFKVRCS